MAEKDNMKVNTSPVADVETGTAEDVEAIMKKYDRESNTRIWEGTPKQVIRFLLAAFSVLMLYMNLFANWDERVRRSLFVGFVIILSFLVYPMKKGSSNTNQPDRGYRWRDRYPDLSRNMPPRCRYSDPLCGDILCGLCVL